MHGPGEAGTSAAARAQALPDQNRLEEGVEIRGLLQRNTEELTGVLRALNGEYILPEAGGDLLRDGAGVLPTGGLSLIAPQTLTLNPKTPKNPKPLLDPPFGSLRQPDLISRRAAAKELAEA